ncbi:MAG: hypothetical protein BWX72_01584 [Firmicutes bacterium ADurb.Bin080]|nr:MAG: hypothetical protein BWX72_01584 [Firmicutes bacterium ADurb.Bin080]
MKSKNLFISLVLIFLISAMPFSVVKTNDFGSTGSVEAAQSPIAWLVAGISTDKSIYCVDDSIKVYYKLSSINGKAYSLYYDLVEYLPDGTGHYLVYNEKMYTNAVYTFTTNVGNYTGTRRLELIIRSTEYLIEGNWKCSYTVSNCNTKKIMSSSSKYDSVEDVIKTIEQSDSSLNITKLSYVKYLHVGDFLRGIHTGEPISDAVIIVAHFLWEMAECLSDRGLFDGVLYVSVKNKSPSIGLIIISDKKEVSNPWNYLICAGEYFLNYPLPQSSIIDQRKVYTLEKCQWTIDNRFDVFYLSYSEKQNNVKNNILDSLGGCNYCCNKIYIIEE